MAELALTAIASMAATAGTATAVAGTAAAGAGALSTLSSVATIGSMVSTLVGGFTAYREGQTQSRFAELNADAARISAEQEANKIQREHLQRVAAARVAFGASGADASSSLSIEDSLASDAKYNMSIAKSAGEINSASSMAEAAAARGKGGGKLLASVFKAGGTYMDHSIDIANRGV